MLVIVPALLIAKAATLLPMNKWEFTPEALASYLTSVDIGMLQAEGDTTVRMLVSMHTALVLVQAATGKFVNNTMVVSGFDKAEVGEEDAQGNFQPGAIQKNAEEIAAAPSKAGADLHTWLSGNTANQLQQYLEGVVGLPADFQVESCLTTCRQAAKHNDINGRYLLTALTVIQSIFEVVDLDQVRIWSNDPHVSGNTSSWLLDKLDADTLEQPVKDCFGASSPCSAETKMTLHRIVQMLENNDRFFHRISERLEKLQETIDNEFPPALVNEKAAWTYAVRLLWAAAAWQIFHQAQIATREARAALGRS